MFSTFLAGQYTRITCHARRRHEITCVMEPMSPTGTHLNQNVTKCFHNRVHCGKRVCNNETKCDKSEPAKERAMCYIVTTDFIF